MGLLGMVIIVAIMVFGAGYLLFGSSHGNFTVENPGMTDNRPAHNDSRSDSGGQPITGNSNQEQVTMTGEIAQGMAVLEAAKNAAKQETADTERVADVMNQGTADKGQGTDNSENFQSKIISRLVSFGYAVPKSPRTIDTVVLHASYDAIGNNPYSVDGVIAEWKSYSVAPHYLIDRKGNVFRLVADENIAYHAGVSKMPDGRTNVNDFSIGIELLDTKEDNYTDGQYASANALIASLNGKYGIRHVVGHVDIAPGRKTDPWNFDWKRLK
jgi:hypothetical protein